MRNLGIPVKAIDYVEIDEKAVRSYNAMVASELPYRTQDVRGWNLKPDILIHGSPCQDFSIAGRQKGADPGSGTRSSLMWETLNIVKNMGLWRPRIIIWENVKNVRSKYMVHNHERYMTELKKLGYTSSFRMLDARNFGLPQARQRIFTISVLGGQKKGGKPLDISMSRIRRDIDRACEAGRQYTIIPRTGDNHVDAAICTTMEAEGYKVARNQNKILISWY